MRSAQTFEPTFAERSRGQRGEVVARYDTYVEAERAVDQLSDSGFPVDEAEIVGRDLRLVEQITGRMTVGRATAAGAGTGAWFGLLVGFLLGLFAVGPAWVGLIIAGLAIGAVWGALFGLVAQWAQRGRRDFSSQSGLVAARYDVTVSPAHAERARQLLFEAA